jgi:hypothetical protein
MLGISAELVEVLKTSPAKTMLIEAEINGNDVKVCSGPRNITWQGITFFGLNCKIVPCEPFAGSRYLSLNVEDLPVVDVRFMLDWSTAKLGDIRILFALTNEQNELICAPSVLISGKLLKLAPISTRCLHVVILEDESLRSSHNNSATA